MYLLVIYIPITISLICLFYAYKIGNKGACILSILGMGFTNIFSLFIFYEVGITSCPTYIKMFNWIKYGSYYVEWGHSFDSLTCIMLIVITSISFVVHVFSASYMKTDPNLPRFMAYLSLFTFFMLILVTSPNFLQLFVGWEGVGLSSYLLINFWAHRAQANKSAIKAMLINRVGDIGLSIAIFCIFNVYNTLDMSSVFTLTPYISHKTLNVFGFDFYLIDFLCFFIFFGIIGKSAQIWLHAWLPDAMEGPTPVSALIHAATMVTAGVFLLARCSPLFEFSFMMRVILVIVGLVTIIVASILGMSQFDLKKTIAYSTCSQLGYMIYSAGSSDYMDSIYHLSMHAFFKAMLFISAGVIINAMNGEQDTRVMGGLYKNLPFSSTCYIIASITLMGIPFLSGFFSKDSIIEAPSFLDDDPFIETLVSITNFFALITGIYSLNAIHDLFFSDTINTNVSHDADFLSTVALMLLLLGSMCTGYFLQDLLVGIGTDFWNESIYVHDMEVSLEMMQNEFADDDEVDLPLIFSVCSFLFVKDFGLKYETTVNKKFYAEVDDIEFIERKINMDSKISWLSRKFMDLSFNNYTNLDRGIFELIGPYGITKNLYIKYSFLNRLKYNIIFDIIFLILLFIFFLSTIIVDSPELNFIMNNKYFDFSSLVIIFSISFIEMTTYNFKKIFKYRPRVILKKKRILRYKNNKIFVYKKINEKK